MALYCIRQSEDHTNTLMDIFSKTVTDWTSHQPDIFLVTSDGGKVFTNKTLLRFYSQTMRDVLDDLPVGEIVGISVPSPASSVFLLLELLTSGSVSSNRSIEGRSVTELAEYLGIPLEASAQT
jgi:hypothetical protein